MTLLEQKIEQLRNKIYSYPCDKNGLVAGVYHSWRYQKDLSEYELLIKKQNQIIKNN